MYRFPIDTIFQFNGNEITDASRGELSVDTEKIMNENRMVNGTLRRYVVAEKRTWSCAWENLFSKDEGSVDGGWNGESIRDFYQSTPGEFWLTITSGDGETEQVLVMFSSFSYTVTKRTESAIGDLWTMSLELVEV
ncbi:minor tail protein [Rhodococcus phage NiceHouse]|nr:minor tail protein [Rhodococcus phage NiceHouse]